MNGFVLLVMYKRKYCANSCSLWDYFIIFNIIYKAVNIPTRHFRSLEGSTDALVAAIIPLQDYQHKTINLNLFRLIVLC